MDTKRLYPNLFLLIFINLVVFIPAIFFHPSFLTDDYYIFSRISQNLSAPVSFNPSDEFFLFLRPTVYFSFWLDFNLWHTNAFGMKITSLLLHLIYVSIFLITIFNLKNFLRLSVPDSVLVLIAVAFSLYPDHLISIIWISNRTEILSSLFYILSIFSAFVYLTSEKSNSFYLTGYLISFVFSILSKQQGLHLPILIVALLIIFKYKFSLDRLKKVIYVSLAAILITIFSSLLNYITYQEYIPLDVDTIKKKPFTLIGIILYVINPIIGDQLYSFFILNKTLALVMLVILLLSIIFLIKRYKIKTIFIGVLILLIIFYPRILTAGQSRLNSIQVYWFYIAVALVTLIRFKKSKIIFLSFIFITITNLLSMIINYNNDLSFLNIEKKKIEGLWELKEAVNKKPYIVICSDIALLPYQLYFYKYKKFGFYNIDLSTIHFRTLTPNLDGLETNKIKCILDSNVILIETVLNKTFIMFDDKKIYKTKIAIKGLIKSDEQRNNTYKSLSIKIPDYYFSEYEMIYFDGKNWSSLN